LAPGKFVPGLTAKYQAGDHQLPHVQTRARRPLLRQDFWPLTTGNCLCGKYKRMKHRGVICDSAAFEVTLSKVRRERLGHIELFALFALCSSRLPSRIGYCWTFPCATSSAFFTLRHRRRGSRGGRRFSASAKSARRQNRELQKGIPGPVHPQMGAEHQGASPPRRSGQAIPEELREKMKTDPSLQKRIKFASASRCSKPSGKSGTSRMMILDGIRFFRRSCARWCL